MHRLVEDVNDSCLKRGLYAVINVEKIASHILLNIILTSVLLIKCLFN